MTCIASFTRRLAYLAVGVLSTVALLCATTAVANADPVLRLDVTFSNGSHGNHLILGQPVTVTAQMTGDGTPWAQGCYLADLFLLQGSGWRLAGAGTSSNGSTQIEHVDAHGVVDIPADSSMGGWPPNVWHANHNGAANGTVTDTFMPGNASWPDGVVYLPGDYTLAASCLPDTTNTPWPTFGTYAAVGPVLHLDPFNGATAVNGLNADGNTTPGSTVVLNTHASGPSVLGTCANPTFEVVAGNWQNTNEPRIYEPRWQGDLPYGPGTIDIVGGRSFYGGGVGVGAGTTYPQATTGSRFVPSNTTWVSATPPYTQPANGHSEPPTPWYVTAGPARPVVPYAVLTPTWLGYPQATSTTAAQVSLDVPSDGSWGEGPFTVIGGCGIVTADDSSAGFVTTVSAPFYIRAVTPPTTTPPTTPVPTPPASNPPTDTGNPPPTVPPTSVPPTSTPPTTWVTPPHGIPYTG